MGWEKLSFDWEQGILQFWIPEGEFQFHFGTESYLQQCFLDTGYTCECIGYWKMGHFILKCFVMGEEMGNVQIDFAWKDSRLSMRAVCTPDAFKTGMEKRFQGFASAEYNNV